MKLTRRQEEFVNNLFELSAELEGPIHYSVLAERLGVSPFTAYDMLCLLEEKGLASSEYQLAINKSGPGRAERVFYPTESAIDRRQRLTQETGVENLDYKDLKNLYMDRIHKGELKDKELIEEMLARIPPNGQGPLNYCMEVMTVVGLRLRQCPGRRVIHQYIAEILPSNSATTAANLSLLGGLSFGVLSIECSSDQEWVSNLFEHLQIYMDIVAEFKPADCRRLGEYLIPVFNLETEGEPVV